MVVIDSLFKIAKEFREKKAIAEQKKSEDEEEQPLVEEEKSEEKEDLYVTTTGLVVHSLAEGIAMGSSLYSKLFCCQTLTFLVQFNGRNASSVGFVVTLALFIHKAPEALGFGSYLKHKGATTKE